MRIANYLRPDCVALRQRADSLTGAVQQMVTLLNGTDNLTDTAVFAADVRRKHSGVSQIVSPVQQCNHLLHCTGERVCPLAQCDAVRPQVVGDAHGLSLRLVPLCSGSCRCSADFAAQY